MMHDRRGRIPTAWALAALVVGLAVSARGHGFGRGDFGSSGGGPRGPRAGGLVQQLVFPCRAGCSDDGRDCVDTAVSDAVTCAEGACATEIATAQTACQADRTSEACATARTALVTCAQSCLATAQSAIASCRTTLDGCIAACGNG